MFTRTLFHKPKCWLLLIFFLTLALRLYFAFQVPNLTHDSYFHLRQVEHITQTGMPLFNDGLSYGGRELAFLPFFHYFAAFFALIFPLEIVAKILPNFLWSTLPLIIYFLAEKISKNQTASLFSALIAAFLPITFTPNAFRVEALMFPLIFLAIYYFLSLEEKRHLFAYVLLFLLLSLTNSATFLVVIGLGIYIILSAVEGKKITQAEMELILFSFFFFVWTQFLFFKDIFAQEGLAFVWQNVPSAIISQYFPQVSLIEAVILVNVIPFVAGIFVVYRSLFKAPEKKTFLFISFAISTAVFAWLRLIQFRTALAFFGLILAVLFALFYEDAVKYFSQTKAYSYQKYFPYFVFILLLITMVPPAVNAALTQNTPTDEEIRAFRWIQENTPKNAGIVALLEEGNLVTYFSQKRNMMDAQFGLIHDVDRRFTGLSAFFTSSFQTEVLDIAEKYQMGYLVFSMHARNKYQLKNVPSYSKECFQRTYHNETIIYKISCSLQPIEGLPLK